MILKVNVSPTGNSDFIEEPAYGLVVFSKPSKVVEEIQKMVAILNDHSLESVSKNLHTDFVIVESHEDQFDPTVDFYDQVEEFDTVRTRYDKFSVTSSMVIIETYCKYSGQGYEAWFSDLLDFVSILESDQEFVDLTRTEE